MSPTVFDYADYVEMRCEERDVVYSSQPSFHDVERSAGRFIDPADKPPNPFAVPYEYADKMLRRWMQYRKSRHQLFGQWYHHSACPICRTALAVCARQTSGTPFRAIAVRVCRNCGWWDTEEELPVSSEKESASCVGLSIHRRAVLREFSVAGCEVPIDALREHLLRHRDSLLHLHPRKLEELVAGVFGEFMDCEAIHVGGPGDGGIDLILVNGKRRYMVQVKRRSSSSTAEPVSGIREFIGAMVLAGELRGLFVSTAARFSKHAVDAATKARRLGAVEYISLVNADRLIDVCRLASAISVPRWEAALTGESNISEHVAEGFHTFLAQAMGHPDWKVAPTSGS